MLSWFSWKSVSVLSATSARCIANFSATAASSGFSIDSIPSNKSSAALFVKRSGWSHIFFRICSREKAIWLQKGNQNIKVTQNSIILQQDSNYSLKLTNWFATKNLPNMNQEQKTMDRPNRIKETVIEEKIQSFSQYDNKRFPL